MVVDGIYVDDSRKFEESDKLALVYLFWTFNAGDENTQVGSDGIKMIINGKNEYDAEHIPYVARYMGSYYYRGYSEDVYIDESLKIVSTFKVPKADLKAGRTITFSDSKVPGISDIAMSTDDIVHKKSAKAIAKEVDPKGYKTELGKQEDADPDTIARVQNALNGYFWTFYTNSMNYRIEFYEPDGFSLVEPLQNDGTYTVKKGYVQLYYPGNGETVDIPYSWKGDEIHLDVMGGFDIQRV